MNHQRQFGMNRTRSEQFSFYIDSNKALDKIQTSPPDCLSTARETYKQTLTELDQMKSARWYKAGKVLEFPSNMPFYKLDLRKQRKLVQSLGKFEIIKAKQTKTRRSSSNLKMIREGSYIQIVPVHHSASKKKITHKKSSHMDSNRIRGTVNYHL